MLDAADGRSVLLITHRPEGLDRVDEIVAVLMRQHHAPRNRWMMQRDERDARPPTLRRSEPGSSSSR